MLLVFLVGLCAVLAQGLQELTADNFASETRDSSWLVEYHSPQCGHCRQFAPAWQQVAKDYSASMNFGTVDCANQVDLCREHEVVRYPAVHYLSPGKPREVVETRSQAVLIDFIRAKVPNLDGVSIDLATSVSWTRGENSGIRPSFVEFYAPWCGHCQKLAPEWETLASALKNTIDIGHVNCEDHRALCIEHQVAALPTLRLFIYNTSYIYDGERTATAMRQYIHDMMGSPVHAWDTQRAHADDVSLVYIDNEIAPNVPDFITQAATQFLDTVRFYHARSDADGIVETLEDLDVQAPAVVLIKDGLHSVYTGAWQNHAALQAWVEMRKYPMVSHLDRPRPGHLLSKLLAGDHGHAHTLVVGILSPTDTRRSDALRQLARDQGDDPGILHIHLNSVNWADYANRVFGVKRHHVQHSVILVKLQEKHYFVKDIHQQPFSLDHPDVIRDAIHHTDGLNPISLTPPKALSTLKKWTLFVGDHSFAFAIGLLFLCAAGFAYISQDGQKEQKVD